MLSCLLAQRLDPFYYWTFVWQPLFPTGTRNFKKSSSSSPVNCKPSPTCSLFCVFWKHLTLVDISLLSITLTAIAPFRAVYMMSSSEKCLLGLIHSCTWLQKGLSRPPCWVFSSERAHSMCTCWGVYPSPLTKYMQAYMYLVTILHIVILSNSKTKHLCSYVSIKILIFCLKLAAYKN